MGKIGMKVSVKLNHEDINRLFFYVFNNFHSLILIF